MKLFMFFIAGILTAGCGTIKHADQQAGHSYRTEVMEREKTARDNRAVSDAVRLAAVQGANTVTVRPLEAAASASSSLCPSLEDQENRFKELCEEHTEGSGDVNIDREKVCVPLRAALDQLRDQCSQGAATGQPEVVFSPPPQSSAGVNINLTGASTGDIRFIIQSPGAADQSTNGVEDASGPPMPESVVLGMSSGLLGFLDKVSPWAAGGYALGKFSEAFGVGMRSAGDRYTDQSVIDQSVTDQSVTDQSIGGDKIDMSTLE